MKIIKNNRGVTLISLVVAIIILGILVTITIVSYYGDNNTTIVDEAKNINKEETKIKVKEEVLFAVMQSMNIYKEIDIHKLNFLLDLKDEITKLPAEIETKDGYKFKINEDGTIEELE